MSLRALAVIAATALAGLAAWPAFVTTREAQASIPAPAPVLADYRDRGRLVSFYEGAVRRHPDQIVMRLLASQYLQRFRETGDAGDALRGARMAERSLTIQPRFNAGAEMTLASALASLHRFREALVHANDALLIEPGNAAALAQVASTDVELGRYDDADRTLRSAGVAARERSVALATAAARYDEVTGTLSAARRLIDHAIIEMDSVMDNPAESRAWFHFRAGELARAAGDGTTAERRFREALQIYPSYARALNGLARLYWGERRWPQALDAAMRAADLVPLPETLGYKADALRALGDDEAARATDDLIRAIARIGSASGINDRALAVYFAGHGRGEDAVAIARRDIAARDDVFAEDTLAWALARSGRWAQARAAARNAVRWNTEDAALQYHAGVIAMHAGERAEAARRLTLALALDPQFHPFDAGDARKRLAVLRSAAGPAEDDVSRVGDISAPAGMR